MRFSGRSTYIMQHRQRGNVVFGVGERSGARELGWIGTASWHLELNKTGEPNREIRNYLNYVMYFSLFRCQSGGRWTDTDSNRDTEVVELSGDLD